MLLKQEVESVLKDEKIPLNRTEVLTALERIITLAFEKLGNRYTQNDQKLAWSRVIVSGCAAAGGLLRDVDLDELRLRVERLERR